MDDMAVDFEDIEPVVENVPTNPAERGSIIKVVGVGGGGGNAVKHMYNQGIYGVDFMLCNTDAQALEHSPIPVKIQIGESGLGAGAVPEVARDAAVEAENRIKDALVGTKMLFVTAGMGGGTGTGAAPIVASIARDMDILTVGIVTYPFEFEGKSKLLAANEGISELRQNVDALIVIKNEALKSLYPDLTFSNAFAKSDDVLLIAARSIAELVTIHGIVNVDFNDVRTILKDSGTAIIGSGVGEGEKRAQDAIEKAIASPLLEQKSIYGAEKVLLFVTYSHNKEVTMAEFDEITQTLEQKTCNMSDKLIWGHGIDETLGDKVQVTIIATGFHEHADEPKGEIKVKNQENQEITVRAKEDDGKSGEGNKVEISNTNPQPKQERIRIPLNGTSSDSKNEMRQAAPSAGNSSYHAVPSYDNNMLRKMSDTEISDYLSKPAYQRQPGALEQRECSDFRVNESGLRQEGSAFLQQTSGID